MTNDKLIEEVLIAVRDGYYEGAVETVLITHPDMTRDEAVDLVESIIDGSK